MNDLKDSKNIYYKTHISISRKSVHSSEERKTSFYRQWLVIRLTTRTVPGKIKLGLWFPTKNGTTSYIGGYLIGEGADCNFVDHWFLNQRLLRHRPRAQRQQDLPQSIVNGQSQIDSGRETKRESGGRKINRCHKGSILLLKSYLRSSISAV